MKRPIAIVLVSGGMDSCVTAAIANADNRLAFLHINYGQRTEERELRAFNEMTDFYSAEKKLIVDLRCLKDIGGSALTDEKIEVPTLHSKPAIRQYEVPPTYVPFRNANMLAVAVSWAEVIGARRVYIGAVEEDSSGYPDCREIFYRAFDRVIDVGTRPETKIEIITPLIHMRKGDIVKKGTSLMTPFHLTWSCYRESNIACGECDSCLLRLKGFRDADIDDPIPYKVKDVD
jgi:7-cyano-7-deazaguanine synthase